MDINTNNNASQDGANTQVQDVQPQDSHQEKGNGNLKLDSKRIAIIAVAVVIILLILIPAIATGAAEGKAKKAVKTYVQVFLSGDKKDNDVKWRKFYPKDLEREVEDWAEEYADNRSFEDVEHYKVLNVTKLSGKDVVKILEEDVESFFLGQVSSYSGDDIEKRDLRDLKVSKAYLVTTKFEYDGDVVVEEWLVIKVNGRYGVYNMWDLLYE